MLRTFIKHNNLILPIPKNIDAPDASKLPHFDLRVFLCYYESDAEKFKDLVISKGGIVEGTMIVDFLNYRNQPVGKQYVCIYHYYEDIEMEVKC